VASLLLPAVGERPGFDKKFAVTLSSSNEECSICLATLGACVTTPCGHSFHAACLEHYFTVSHQPQQRARCPLCRTSVHTPQPVEVRAASGLPIEAVTATSGSRCHFDRNYRFLALGSFAKPGTLYLRTSNEDRKTHVSQVMWVLELSVPCLVHLNYRSQQHLVNGGQEAWLTAKGFALNGGLRSSVSSGVPNGPYSGPVYSRVCEAATTLELMGSNTWEGTYFVFVELASAAGT